MQTKKLYLSIVVILSILLCFWKLGDHPLEEWDESRYGLNAYEMLQTGDLVNYYYEKQPDQWNAKPPLSIWLIAITYKIFGFNEFALRLPSALAGVLIFIVFFKLVNLYYSLNISLLSTLILMSTKSIIGSHVARTGDMDSLFVLFVLCSIYFLVRYLREERYFIYLSTIFLGLSFYIKGFTFLLLIPGIILYLILIDKFRWLLLQRKFWFSVTIFLIVCLSWYFIQKLYGNVFDTPQFIGNTSWDTMWKYDISGRFFDYGFEENKQDKQYFFVITNLDVKFNIWNYMFYASLILLFLKYKNGDFNLKNNDLVLLSLCIIITVSIILTISQNKRPWYIAPMIPFVALITTLGINILYKYNIFKVLITGILIFTLLRQFIYVNTVKEDSAYFIKNNKNEIQDCSELKISSDLPQNLKLYAYWFNENTRKIEHSVFENDVCYFVRKKEEIISNSCVEDYCLIIPEK